MLAPSATAFESGLSFPRHDRIIRSSSFLQHPSKPWSSSSSRTRLRISLPEEEDADTTTTTTTTTTTPQDKKGRQAGAATTMQLRPQYYWNYWSTGYELLQAGLVGSLTGVCVAIFKLSIEMVRTISYEQQDLLTAYPTLMALIPAFGGMVVGALLLAGGNQQAFPPGLRGTVQESDQTDPQTADNYLWQWNFLRKSTASVATLGTGNSLGPEGPCVEIGLNVARACTGFHRQASTSTSSTSSSNNGDDPATTTAVDASSSTDDIISRRQWNRVLLSCGAAAGVAAGKSFIA